MNINNIKSAARVHATSAALALSTLALATAPSLAQTSTSTTTTPATLDYGALFNSANITGNLQEMAGYVVAAAVAFGGVSFVIRYIRKFLGR